MQTIVRFLLLVLLTNLLSLRGQLLAQTWTQTSAPVTNWGCIAASANGNTLIAGVGGRFGPLLGLPGPIYISTNAGATWALTSAPIQRWFAVASSSDGATLAAAAYAGTIHLSTNGGKAWFQTSLPAPNHWYSVTCSKDGSKLIVAGQDASSANNGLLYLSTNSGANWLPTATPTTNAWLSVTASSDGRKLAAATSGGDIYVSSDFGASWNLSKVLNVSGLNLASSGDGTQVMAISAFSAYRSTDSGTTWEPLTNGPAFYWTCIAASADGRELLAGRFDHVHYWQPDAVYSSRDAGSTWQPEGVFGKWDSVCCSADGNLRAAADQTGGIWISRSTPAPLLTATQSSGRITISWGLPSMDFVLQQNINIDTGNWMELTNIPTLNLSNLRHEVTVSLSRGENYFRLKH